MIRTLLAICLSSTLLFSQNPVSPAVHAGGSNGTHSFVVNTEVINTIDPPFMEGPSAYRLYLALFEGLVVPNPKTSLAEPGLAESWDINSDYTVYTFHLRDAVWSDGTPITAQDFVDSWIRSLDPDTNATEIHYLLNSIKGARAYHDKKDTREKVGIRALDTKTLEVTFVKKMPHAINMLIMPCFGIVPMRVVNEFGKDWTQPAHFVGNGAFVLKEWDPNVKITVVKNGKYWDSKNVYLNEISFLADDDEGDCYEKFKTGQIDWSSGIDETKYFEIKNRRDFQGHPGHTIDYYIFNLNKKPFKDVRVRRALSLALDRKELCQKIIGTGQVPADGFVPPMEGFGIAGENTYDPEQAKKLLAEAGYPEGKGFPKIKIIYNTLAVHEQTAEWVKNQWKKVLGIEVKLENAGWDYFTTLRKDHDFEICRGGLMAEEFVEPTNYLQVFRKNNGFNFGQYYNQQFEDSIEKSYSLPLGEVRNSQLKKAEDQVIAQEQAVIPLYFHPNQDLIDLETWGGWFANTLGIHPWKSVKFNPMGGKHPVENAGANSADDCYVRDMVSYYQLDPRIRTGATGLCGPTSSADVIDYFSRKYPNLKPSEMTGFDLIRNFALDENTGHDTGTTDLTVEGRISKYIKKAGYNVSITKLGISTNGGNATYNRWDIEEVKKALKDEDCAILIIIGGYEYDQRDNNYIRDYGHFLVLERVVTRSSTIEPSTEFAQPRGMRLGSWHSG